MVTTAGAKTAEGNLSSYLFQDDLVDREPAVFQKPTHPSRAELSLVLQSDFKH